jgi:hypothetical protein
VPRPSTASGPALIGADLDTPFLTRGLAAGTRLTGLGDQGERRSFVVSA